VKKGTDDGQNMVKFGWIQGFSLVLPTFLVRTTVGRRRNRRWKTVIKIWGWKNGRFSLVERQGLGRPRVL
jgi:hypothetical protein